MPSRKITTHQVSGDQSPQLIITVLDEPGHGGACHRYQILPAHLGNESDVPGTMQRMGAACDIHFQNGPINEHGVNGVTQEALIAICIDRLRSFQAGPFACRANAIALTKLEEALMWFQGRTRDRIARNVEGTTAQ